MNTAADWLRNVRLSDVLSSRELQAALTAEGLLAQTIAQTEKLSLEGMLTILDSDQLKQAILDGYVTLALIKPDLQNSSTLDPNVTEDEQNRTIVSSITPPLEIILEIVLPMDQETVETWYEGKPRDNQVGIPPLQDNRYGKRLKSRWEELIALMQNGSCTFLLLFNENGNAVSSWRQQMGTDWNVARIKTTEPDSLRARYAADSHNNILHGSDSPESVLREVQLLIALIRKYIQNGV